MAMSSKSRSPCVCRLISEFFARSLPSLHIDPRYDWNSPHFGNPGRTRFHTSWAASRYIRIFRSNPRFSTTATKEVVIDDAREGWFDVQFRVEKAFKNAVESAIDKDLRALESTGALAAE